MALSRPGNTALANISLLSIVAVWGATFALVKDALTDVSPLLFNLLRMTIASAALLLVNRRHLRRIPRPALLSGAIVGLFLAAGYQFQTAGLARTTPVKAAFITGLIVVFVPLLTSIPALRHASTPAPRWPTALGALLAFLGLALLTTPAGSSPAAVFTTIGIGDILVLLCALAFAGHLLSLSHLAHTMPTPQIATLQILACTVIMLFTLPLSGPLYLHPTPRLFVALAITGLVATAAAFTIQSWAQRFLAPANTAMLLTLEPVFALLVSTLFLHERLTLRSLSGAALILSGIAAIELLALPNPIPIDPA